MANAGHVSQSAKTPAEFLKSIKGKPVVVKLNSGVDYRGEAMDNNFPGFMDEQLLKNVVVSTTGERLLCRNFGMPGWLHEHCHGVHRGDICNNLHGSHGIIPLMSLVDCVCTKLSIPFLCLGFSAGVCQRPTKKQIW